MYLLEQIFVKCSFLVTESFVLQIYFLTNINFALMQLHEYYWSLKFSSPLDLPQSVFRSLFVHRKNAALFRIFIDVIKE